MAEALNPLLRPLRRDVTYAVERCADEVAVRAVGDRGLVAETVGRAALLVRDAAAGPPGIGLAVASGPVPRRVVALLASPPPPHPRHWWGAVMLSVIAVSSTAAALHAGYDLHVLLEVAELHCSAL